MMETQPSPGGRIVFRPPDVTPWIEGKTVAMIGDGPSKRQYIFAPDRVTTFAVNKAAPVYPCSMCAVVGTHFDEIMVQLYPYTPVLYFGPVDIRRYNIGPGLWTVVCLLSFLAQHAAKVYIQGMDMTEEKYHHQAIVIREMITKGLIDKDKIRLLNGGPLADLFPVVKPETSDIC